MSDEERSGQGAPAGGSVPPADGGVPDLSAEDDEDLTGPPRWAAEEPTAMWSDGALRDQGYEDLAEHRREQPRVETGPATRLEVGGMANARVELGADIDGGRRNAPQRSGAQRPPKGGVSWGLTIGLAVGLAVVVFFVVRFLR